LGTTTIAGGKFGASGMGAEGDIGNLFISCGFVGGFLYLTIVVYTIWRSGVAWHLRRDFSSLCTFAILVSTFGTWMNGARYSECMIIWFLVGTLDRADREEQQKKLLKTKMVDGSSSKLPNTTQPGNTLVTAPTMPGEHP
jgi:hypothetical protein